MIAFRVGRNFFMRHTTNLSDFVDCLRVVGSGSEGPGYPQSILILVAIITLIKLERWRAAEGDVVAPLIHVAQALLQLSPSPQK
jgi:hypothetical protein